MYLVPLCRFVVALLSIHSFFRCNGYTLYIVPDVEVLQFVGDDEIFLRLLQANFHQSLDADTYFRTSGHQFLIEFRVLQFSEDLNAPAFAFAA